MPVALQQRGYKNKTNFEKFNTSTCLKYPQSADDHGEEWEVENQQGDDEDEELDGEVGDDEEENERVDVMCGDQGAEPLHASTWRPVDEVLLYLQQSVERELEQLVEGNIRQTSACKAELKQLSKDTTRETHFLCKDNEAPFTHALFPWTFLDFIQKGCIKRKKIDIFY